jgi:hypothetical protein
MDARVASQRYADADKVRSFIAEYVVLMPKKLQMRRTLLTILVLTGSISLS